MAKRANDQDGSPDKGGMRILYVELNGSNASLQEGLRTLVAAMNKPVQVSSPAPRRVIANQNAAIAEQEPEPNSFNQDPGVEEAEIVQQGEQQESTSSTVPRRQRGDGPKKDYNSGISIVKTLELRPSGKQSLKN